MRTNRRIFLFFIIVLVLCFSIFMLVGCTHNDGGNDTNSEGNTVPIPKVELTPTEIYTKVDPSVVFILIENKSGLSSGTGFFIDDKGTVVTNYHVVEGCVDGSIKTKDGFIYDLDRILLYDEKLDIAILKTNAINTTFVEVGNGNEVLVGSPVYAIGYPEAFELGASSSTFTSGMVSTIRTMDGNQYIQSTVDITHGNSGGPLIDKYGQVVGITTAGLRFSDIDYMNLSIPINIEMFNYNILTIENNVVIKCNTNAKEVVIPEGVTGIADFAFDGCSNLSDVKIPNSVISIGTNAFSYCSNLTDIEIPNSVTKICDSTFEGCSNLGSIKIPNSVTNIGTSAFYGCPIREAVIPVIMIQNIPKDNLVNVIINGGDSIDNNSFKDCRWLTNIEIANSVTSIGSNAFNGCSGLKSVVLPDNITKICDSTFKGCINLSDIKIPNSVTSIENNVFENCSSLTNIEISNSVTSIGSNAFNGCSGLKSVVLPDNITKICDSTFKGCINLSNIIVPNNVTNIENNAFENCSNLTNIEIANNVTNIGASAFNGCSGLNSVVLSDNIIKICDSTFKGCINLLDIKIPSSVTSIENNAFENCSSLTNIEIPNSVTNIGTSAFSGCSGLTRAILSNNIKNLNDSTFKNCSSLASIEVPNGVANIGSSIFDGCSSLTKIKIPISVTAIGENAFSNCCIEEAIIATTAISLIPKHDLKSVIIYEGSTIDPCAFENCSNLTNVEIANSVTNIGFNAFNGCSGLESVVLSDNITKICDSTFKGCINLSYIKIPNSVTSIENNAFGNCRRLINIEISSSVTTIADNAFSNCYIEEATIATNVIGLIPKHNLKSVIIDEGSTIDPYAFENCTNLKNIVILDGVTSIGSSAFDGCTSLTNITIPNSVTNIGEYAFYDCSGLKRVDISNIDAWCRINFINSRSNPLIYAHNLYLNGELVTSLTIPNSVTSIGNYAFDGCTSLTNITIPSSVTKIGEYAFDDCSGLNRVDISDIDAWFKISFGGNLSNPLNYAHNLYLNGGLFTDLIIPGSLVSVGNYTFEGCSSLSNLVISEGITSVGSNTFKDCSNLVSLTFPNSITSIGDSSFLGCIGLSSITIPYSITSIGNHAFDACSGLNRVDISDIDAWCRISFGDHLSNPLYYAHELYLNGELFTDLIIPNGVKEIKPYIFVGCNNLINIEIPSSVTSIGDCAFAECNYIESAIIPAKAVYAIPKGNLRQVIINSGLSIADRSFEYCDNLMSISMPSVTSIGERAFYCCKSLTNINISSEIEAIGAYAFYKCPIVEAVMPAISVRCIPQNNLKNVIINGGSIIDYQAFFRCYTLESIEIPNSIISIGPEAFSSCTRLKRIEIPMGVMEIYYDAFYDCRSLSIYCEALSKPAGWSSNWNSSNRPVEWKYNNISTDVNYDYVVHNNNVYLTNYKGNDSVIEIPDKIDGMDVCGFGLIFSGNTNITSLTMPNSVTRIDDSAFANCSNLSSITISNSLKIIEPYTFLDCNSLKSIVIHEGVISIGVSSFSGCNNLSNIKIPSSLKSIGKDAFNNCYHLERVDISDSDAWCRINFNNNLSNPLYYAHNLYLNGELLIELTIPDSITSIGSSTFYGCRSLSSIIIPNSVTSIGSSAFDGCSSLSSIIIPNSVTSIGSSAFYGCRSLSSITIPDSVTSIGECAFQRCSNLKSIIIPRSLYLIENYTFSYCSSLTSIIIPEGVKIIDYYAFENCSSLTEIEISSTVETIDYGVFADCSSLISIKVNPNNNTFKLEGNCILTKDGKVLKLGCKNSVIPSSVTSIDSKAFSGCIGLTSITIPSGLTSIGDGAFSGCIGLTSIIIPRSVTSIGNYAFDDCNLTIYCETSNKLEGWNANWNSDNLPVIYYGCTGEEIIYRFDTGLGSKIDPIISKGIINIENLKSTLDGKVLVAWYDNPECSGNPIVHMWYYSTTKTTLYAKWLDCPILEAGTSKTMSIANSTDSVYFKFVANETRNYTIKSLDSYDTVIYLCDENLNVIVSSNDEMFTHGFISGETYYISVRMNSGIETGDVNLIVE